YNAAGVAVQELDQNTTTSNRTFVSGAGLIDSTVSRDSQVVRFGYDAVGRLAWKAWGQRSWTALSDDGHLARPAGTVLGDSVVYQYDIEGRLLVVRGTRAGADSVLRTYWANGALRTVVTTMGMRDSLSFRYDTAGALEYKAHVTVQGLQVARDT